MGSQLTKPKEKQELPRCVSNDTPCSTTVVKNTKDDLSDTYDDESIHDQDGLKDDNDVDDDKDVAKEDCPCTPRARAMKDTKSQTVLTSHNFTAPKRPSRRKPRPKHPKPTRQLHQKRLFSFVTTTNNKRQRPRALHSKSRTSPARPPSIKLYQPTLFQLQAREKPSPEIHYPPDLDTR